MRRIRPLRESDIPQVATLYEQVVRSGRPDPPDGLAAYFERTFLDHPWRDDDIPSLVYESASGRVSGFIGSHVRRLEFDGRPLRMACSGQLFASPEARHEAPGAFLLAEYLKGPQDLWITDGANTEARRILARLGATTLYVNCLDWIRVLRPATVAAEFTRRHHTTPVPRALVPALSAVDAVAASIPGVPLRPRRPHTLGEPLTPEMFRELLPTMAHGFDIRPDYEIAFLEWLFEEMARVESRGRLMRTLVSTPEGRPLGWYVAYFKAGVSEVIQVMSLDRDTGSVLDHLFRDAYDAGASALRGRLEGRLLTALWGRGCALRYGVAALAQADDPAIIHAVSGGRALLTRLDGEWWMGHHTETFERRTSRNGASSARRLRAEVVDDVDALRDDWSRLAEESRNVFSSWEWNVLWWRRFGAGRRAAIVVCRDAGGTARAIVPLYRWTGLPLTVLRFLGHGHGDLLGPICAREPDVWSEALQVAFDVVRCDILVGDLMPGDRRRPPGLEGKVLSQTGYPILDFRGASWDEYLATRSSSFRKDIRRLIRRLEGTHEVSYRLTTSAESLDGDLDILFALHRARFDSHDVCLFCGGANETFQRDFARRALELGWLRLWILEVDGQAVAADYAFRFAGAEFAYQAGRDPSWDWASVGFVLQAHVIREASGDGLAEYRFLEGDESYKYRYTDFDPRLETVAIAGSLPGRAAIAGAKSLRRVPLAVELWKQRGR